MAEVNKGTLVFLTSDGWVTLSSKVMQIFSPQVKKIAHSTLSVTMHITEMEYIQKT